ncbi:hypothetical protein [Lacrimispora brassicae]
MSCYCREIRKCEADIRKISHARKRFQEASQCNDGRVKNHINNLELNHSLCITPDNIGVLSEAILLSNRLYRQRSGDLLDHCEQELSSLEERLSDMERWDYNYHEREEDD